MKGFWAITVIATILVLGLGFSQNVFGATYQHEKFTIDYPDDWEVQVESGDELLGGFEFVKFADELLNYSAKVVVIVWPDGTSGYSTNMDLKQFIIDGSKWWCDTSSFDDVGRTCSDYEVLEADVVKRNGLDLFQAKTSFTLVWEEGASPEQWRAYDHEYIVGNDIWEAYGEVWFPEYDEYFDDIEASVNSFKLDEKFVEEKTKKLIPDWVRNIFIWYGEGTVSDNEVINAIKFLVNQGIIQLE